MTKISRRHFLAATGAITGSALLSPLSEIKSENIGISTPTVKKDPYSTYWYRIKGNIYVGKRFGEGVFQLY